MNTRTKNSSAQGANEQPPGEANGAGVAAPAGSPVRAVYHAGPAGMTYAGKRWALGVEQTLTAEEWAAIQARPSHAAHAFKAEHVTGDAA